MGKKKDPTETRQRRAKANAEYPTYVWMRQINERFYRLEQRSADLEANQCAQAVQERAESEALMSAKDNALEARIELLEELARSRA